LALALAAVSGRSQAHDPGLSTLGWTVSDSPARAHWTLSVDDDVLPEARRARSERCRGRHPVAVALRSVQLPARVSCRAEPDGRTHFEASFLLDRAGTLRLSLPLLDELPRGHVVYAKLERPNGRPAVQRILRQSSDSLEVELEAQPAASFLRLGIERFASHPSQLLIVALLLWGLRSPRRAAACGAAFIAAHALGVALTGLGLVRVAHGLVALAAASSIALVALYTWLKRRSLGERLEIALLLGLVHGLHFAPELEQLGLQGAQHANAIRALLEFGAGLALGQLALGVVAWLALRPVRRMTRAEPLG
jgi:HupE / UreJ protein